MTEGAKFCQQCGRATTLSGETPVPEYFVVSPGKLAFFSILTLGLYELYWFYRNWQAVKKAEGTDISPLWRTLLSIFYCHPLFKRVAAAAREHDYPNLFSAKWVAAAYILILLAANALGNVDTDEVGFNLLWLAVTLSSFIPLLTVQGAINFLRKKMQGPSVLKSGFSTGEVVLVVLGVLWFCLILIGIFSA